MLGLSVLLLAAGAGASPIIAIDRTAAGGSAAAANGIGLTQADVLLLAAGVLIAGLFLQRRWHRLRRAPRRPLLFMAPAGLGLFLAMIVLGVIGVQAARALFGLETGPDGPVTIRAQAGLTLGLYLAQALFVLVYAVLLRRLPAPAPDRRAGPARALAFGAAGLVLFWPMAIATTTIVTTALVLAGASPPEVIAHETLNLLRSAEVDAWFALLTGLVIVVGPVTEEVMYRGLLQETLGRAGLSRWGAVTATSVLFAAMHYDAVAPHALAGLFVLSLGFGWVYEKTGRLSAAITMHVLFNLGNVVMAYVLV